MRSRLTIDSVYHVYTQSQNLQDMAEVAVELWEQQLDGIDASKRRAKVDKMLALAKQMPNKQFGAFAEAIATTVDARASRKPGVKTRPAPVPVPAVVQRETELQRLTRNLDLQGIILGGMLDVLKVETPDEERLWLYAQTRLVERMQQGGLPQACDALMASFSKEGWGLDVIKQCVEWLNVGALNGLLAQVFAQLGKVWAQVAEDEKARKTPPPLTVAQTAELYPTRVLLRVLGLAGLRELAAVPPDSPLENALATRLKDFVPALGDGIANQHVASQLHGLFELYEHEGEKAFAKVPFTGTQKQAARMYCRVVAFVQKQERTWQAIARECMEAEAIQRVDRRLKKNPHDPMCWVDRARALSDYRNDQPGALAALDHVPKEARDGAYARERAIVLGKMGRLPDVLGTLNEALATPDWEDKTSLAKLFCVRAEARLHAKDALGAWGDARRATLVAPTTDGLPDLNRKVLAALDAQWEQSLTRSLHEEPGHHTFGVELAQARNALLHERWAEAAKIKESRAQGSEAAQGTAKQVAALAEEMAAFFTAAQAHPDAPMPEGLTPEMLELLRQSGFDPSQAAGLATITEDEGE